MSRAKAEWFKGKIGRTAAESRPHWRPPVAIPPGAPNVVVIVLDDVGYADLGCYGSEIATPNIDRLADEGLRYRNFHVTALCSPTRASLLTGRNAHSAGVGIISEWSNGYPGYEGRISHQACTIPEVLSDHGYACHAVGKWHLTNMEHYSAAGPHHDWPCGRGFDTWYGFHGALIDHWNPELYQDNQPIDFQPGDGYHLSADLVDKGIARIRDHRIAAPGRPFFLYLAFGACHWPHHVPAEYVERYAGVYDAGWDAVRSARFERQKALGIIPAEAELAPRNPGVDAWDDVEPDVRRLAVRLQETYAGFLEHTDAQIGRLLAHLKASGLEDDTLVILMSDNGASAEGGPTGALNLRKQLVYEVEGPEVGLAALEKIGSEFAFNHYPTGWAQVSNTPLKWYKKDAHGGGIRAPILMRWPGRIPRGQIRTQYHHVSDVAATIYDLVGVSVPETRRGVPQIPLHGVSMVYSFEDPDARTTRHLQHYEVLGDRAIWRDGLKAVARHVKGEDFDSDRWELYDTNADFSECDDLAERRPELLKELIDLWWTEAESYGVLPLDDREWERAVERMRMAPRTRYVLHQNMARLDRLLAPDITERDFDITVEFQAASRRDEGVLLAWGSRFGGLSLHLHDGDIVADYLYSESEAFPLRAALPEEALRSLGYRVRRLEDRKAAQVTLFANDRALAARRIPKTWPTHGLTAGLTCGYDGGCPVSDGSRGKFRFTGRIARVIVEIHEGPTHNGEEVLRTLLAEE